MQAVEAEVEAEVEMEAEVEAVVPSEVKAGMEAVVPLEVRGRKASKVAAIQAPAACSHAAFVAPRE